MAATIFVWAPHGKQIGHASLGLSDGTYISWWPGSDDPKDVLDSTARSYGMRNDKKEEKGIPTYASAPINNLNEHVISI